MRTKVIIVSADMNIKRFLAEEMAKAGYLVEFSLNTRFDVPNFFASDCNNVFLLDTDSRIVPPEHLSAITKTYGLFVILLGIKNATPYLLGGVRGALSKPDSADVFAKKVFAQNIIERIEHFTRSSNKVAAIDLRQTANVDDKIVAIAASTGGTEALSQLLSALPARIPPFLIVQHMPSVFTQQFATRLDKNCKFTVKEASFSDSARENCALIAPGDFHMKAVKRSGKLLIECFQGEKVHGVRPAADILFESMAEFMGKNVIGIILTGMGADGARGLFRLKKKGATIIAQDRETSVVYGMPKAAAEMGIVDYQLPLNKIASKIIELL